MTNSTLRTRGASVLSDDDVGLLRGLILRRKHAEAEGWLRSHGFSERPAQDIILEQELAVSDYLFLTPRYDFVAAAILVVLGLLCFGFAANNPAEEAFPYDPTFGTDSAAYGLLIVCCLGAALFASRGVWSVLRMCAALVRYPLHADASWVYRR